MSGCKEAILGGVNYMLCLREGNFSLPFVLSTVLILLWGLLLPWPLVPTAQRQPPLRRQPQSCTGLHSSQEAKAATAEVTSASGICVQAQLLSWGLAPASCQAGNLQPNIPGFAHQCSPPASSIQPCPSFRSPS